MKIVYCIPALYNSGGMERVLTVKANYLAEKCRHEVWIVTTSQEGKDFFYPLLKTVHHLDLGINYFSEEGNILKKVIQRLRKKRLHRQRLAKLLSEIKPDITVSLFTHEMTFLPKIKDGSKKILEYHFSREMEQIKRKESKQSLLQRILISLQNRVFHRAIAKYHDFILLTRRDAEAWGNLPNSRVISNPLTVESTASTANRMKIVLSVGRLCPQKGFDYLLNAWSQIHRDFADWSLEIVGGGPQEKELRTAIEENRLENSVRIVPPTREIGKKYSLCAIFAATSRYEGLHLSLLEAQGSGMPAVTFDCPCGPAEIVDDGKTGYVVSLGDVSGFAEKLRLLMQDEVLRTQMGENAKIRAQNEFSVGAIMKKWESLFCNITKQEQTKI